LDTTTRLLLGTHLKRGDPQQKRNPQKTLDRFLQAHCQTDRPFA